MMKPIKRINLFVLFFTCFILASYTQLIAQNGPPLQIDKHTSETSADGGSEAGLEATCERVPFYLSIAPDQVHLLPSEMNMSVTVFINHAEEKNNFGVTLHNSEYQEIGNGANIIDDFLIYNVNSRPTPAGGGDITNLYFFNIYCIDDRAPSFFEDITFLVTIKDELGGVVLEDMITYYDGELNCQLPCFREVNVSAAPNPTTGSTLIMIDNPTDHPLMSTAVIYNRFGKEVHRVFTNRILDLGSYKETIDLRALPSDTYHLVIVMENRAPIVEKLVIMQ